MRPKEKSREGLGGAGGSALGWILGLGVVVAGVGAVVYFTRRKTAAISGAFGGALSSDWTPPAELLDADVPVARFDTDDAVEEVDHPELADVGTMVSMLPLEKGSVPVGRSYTLPGPGANAIRLISSTDKPFTVMIRVVDPPGAFGVFAFDASQLNGNLNAVPVGDTIIIPVGQWQSIPLAPYSALYGRGSGAAVVASVTGYPNE